MGTLSALSLIFNQADVTCLYMSWWDDEPQKEMRCPEQNVSLSESSLLAATIIGMISCPCMDSRYWWEFEIEFRENPCRSWGLRWRLLPPSWPHLPCFYWLWDDKCWQIVCALLFCQTAVRSHSAWAQAQCKGMLTSVLCELNPSWFCWFCSS